MPTYLCRVSVPDLDARAPALAEAITRVHAEVTGAPGCFAQVLIERLADGGCFLGARPLEGPHCFVHGHIRAGRSAQDRSRLVEQIVAATAHVLAISADAVWVYLSELPPPAMAEYGVPLPEPGDEARWLDALPERTRLRLAK